MAHQSRSGTTKCALQKTRVESHTLQRSGSMDVFYKNARLAKVFQSAALLRKSYGAENAERIKRRLFVLESVEYLGEVPRDRPERCHPLTGEYKGCFAVDVLQPFRILLAPSDAQGSTKTFVDPWQRARAVTILDVLDYH